MGFSRQEYGGGLRCPPPGNFPNPGITPSSLSSLALSGRFFTTSAPWETHIFSLPYAFLGGTNGKEPACQFKRCKRPRFDLWVTKIPWRREWQPTPVFLPGEFHGQRSLVGYTPWGHKESDTTWVINTHTHTIFYIHSRQIVPGPVNMCPFLGTSMIFYSISYLLFSTCWTTMIWRWHKIAMALHILIWYPLV